MEKLEMVMMECNDTATFEFYKSELEDMDKGFNEIQRALLPKELKDTYLGYGSSPTVSFEHRFRKTFIEMDSMKYMLLLDKETGMSMGHVSMFVCNNSLTLTVINLFIKEEHRNKGYGTEALSIVDKYAKIIHMKAVKINVLQNNDKALGLYEDTGFEVFSLSMYKPLID